jgi:hypothetical protein
MRAVHASTFDYAIVFNDHLQQFAKDLREFVAYFGTDSSVCHLLSWAEFIEKNLEIEAIGFYGTSVSENLWFKYNEETDESIPYDLETSDKHFDVYDQIEAMDAEPVSAMDATE